LVLVSHSAQLIEGLLEMVRQVAGLEGGVAAAGGAADGSLGTSSEAILRAIDAVDGPDGVLVLMDLGSAVMTAELVLEDLPPERRARVRLSNAPLVEGAVAAAVQASIGGTLDEVAAAAEAVMEVPKVHHGSG
jgi:dihydroxyacetone kinase phosphotransfer subunit